MNSVGQIGTPSESEQEDSEKGGLGARTSREEVVSFFKTLLLFIIAAIILRGSVIEAFKIPSGSMIPTLRIGDQILVSKLSYGLRLPFVRESMYEFATPSRGDIVVFTRPDEPQTMENESDVNIIKRVVGLPGETIEVHDRTVFINGAPIQEEYARWDEGGIPEGDFPAQQIPAGHIFLMGDNRDHSKDSRFWQNPFLDLKLVKGRALFVYWSWDSLSRIGTVIR